jgi:cell division protein FtsB
MQRNQDIARNIINELEAENARLKAEVERLTKAEVERLRKEGEAMYPNLGPGWSHNAKEGKQS